MLRRVGLALVLCASACTKPAPPVAGRYDAAGTDVQAEDYPHVLASWTRDNRLYNGLENKVFVTSVFLTPELRAAVRTAYPDVVGHGGAVTRDELATGPGNDLVFFVTMYTADRKWNDLQAPTSIWKVTLKGASEVAPTSIVRVRPDENMRTVFPFIGRYDETYVLRFAQGDGAVIGSGTNEATLRLASGLGETSLTWQLARGTQPVPKTGEPPMAPAVR
ncbi:MAG: hypothetical protein ACAI38_13620 [Myxococcota bacterium]|nr:hypothetical protein [Myxococcota bacterium]